MSVPPRESAPGEILEADDGIAALEWLRQSARTPLNEGGFGTYVGLLMVLVSTRAYTGRIDPVWCMVERVSPGDASVYPVKAEIPGAGIGQWKITEVLAVALTPWHEDVWRDTPTPHYPWRGE